MAGTPSDQHPNHDNADSVNTELARYFALMNHDEPNINTYETSVHRDIINAPVFTLRIRELISQGLMQYGLIGKRLPMSATSYEPASEAMLINTNAPWSAFICGSQGSGKSHTLSCMLENCLISDEKIGKLQQPMSVMLFNYDSYSSGMPCEAAYLTSHVRVKVVVSPSNFWKMKDVYGSLPNQNNLQVIPLLLNESHLTIGRMKSLMGINMEKGAATPLYIKIVKDVLQEMGYSKEYAKFNYQSFKQKLHSREMTNQQTEYLKMRLELLESFMAIGVMQKAGGNEIVRHAPKNDNVFATEPGTLTIVDLTNPFVDASDACMLFEICLSIFLQADVQIPRAVALDEAHKFLNDTLEASSFTEHLKKVIREQRHVGTRVIISTQEPTIDSSLLDLCSMTIVHRFTSPAWLQVLKGHLAAASAFGDAKEEKTKSLFDSIVRLKTGQGLLFCPSAILDLPNDPLEPTTQMVKFKTRNRLTKDGGQSVTALGNTE